MAEPADFIGPAVVAELNRLLGTHIPAGAIRGFTTPKAQAGYLVGQLGPAGAAARLGVTRRTVHKWMTGGKPTKGNARRLNTTYHEVRDPKARVARRAREQRSLIKKLTSPPPVRVQVCGTVVISDDERYREPFAGTPALDVASWRKIIDVWKRKDADGVGEAFVNALNEALPEISAQFSIPYDDCTVDILAEY